MAVYKNSIPFGSIVTDGLILNLDATNINSYPGSGTTWTDTSGYNNSGTLTNGPTFLRERGRGSIVFDGVDDYVNCGNPPAVNISDNVTVNVWFKINNITTPSIQGLVNKRNPTNYGLNFLGSATANTTFQWYYNTTGTFRVLSVSFYAITGSWYNFCGTFAKNSTNTNSILYANGRIIGSATLSENIAPTTADLIIGATTAGQERLNGNISSVQIYNKALSTQEVQQNYNALKSRFGL